MSSYLCHFGNYGSLGNWGVLNWIGLALNLVFWVGLIAGLILLVILVLRRTRVPATTAGYATRQPAAKEILQAQYARGEVTREQYEVRKQNIG